MVSSTRAVLVLCLVGIILAGELSGASAKKARRGGSSKKAADSKADQRTSSEAAKARARDAKAKPRSPKEWRKLGEKVWDDVDKQWEDGDDPELVKTEDQRLFDEMERHRNRPPKIDPSDPKSFMAAAMMNSNGSPQSMMFATLTELDDEGKKRTKESTDIVSAQWRDLMFTDGINATCYNIEPTIVLCTLMKGWHGMRMRDFMLQQPGVVTVEWNQIKYKPEDFKKDEL